MKFVLSVHQPADIRAIKFAQAALDAGHEIALVFFYHDGIQVADRFTDQGQGHQWQQLAEQHTVPLAVCIGAATRRGLVDESAPEASERIREGFEIVGLGQYIGALVEADRLITFASES